MEKNLYAYTSPSASYPEYISVNTREGKIAITVRSPAKEDGSVGNLAEIVLTPEQAAEMVLALAPELAVEKQTESEPAKNKNAAAA